MSFHPLRYSCSSTSTRTITGVAPLVKGLRRIVILLGLTFCECRFTDTAVPPSLPPADTATTAIALSGEAQQAEPAQRSLFDKMRTAGSVMAQERADTGKASCGKIVYHAIDCVQPTLAEVYMYTTHTHTRKYTHTRVHTYTHTRTHTHIHTCKCAYTKLAATRLSIKPSIVYSPH